MAKIRVLIVDGAVLGRRLLVDLLSGDPAVEVVGTAPNGRLALTQVPQVNPDVVTLGPDLLEEDGSNTLSAFRRGYPLLPVLPLGRPGQRVGPGFEALPAGASASLTLPDGEGGAAGPLPAFREQLLARIKLLGSGTSGTSAPPAAPTRRPPSSHGLEPLRRVEVVAIGASTGGPNALAVLLPALPAGCPVPVLIAQHMPPVFTGQLARRLASLAAIGVEEAVAGATLEPAQAWLAPGDYHLTVARDAAAVRLGLHQGPPENSCRPSVDVLFRSVADAYGAGVLGVVLTGMGQDGLRGCERIRAHGGQILVQDEATSVVWGMPGIVARAGLADKVLPLEELVVEIVRRLRRGRSLSSPGFRSPAAADNGRPRTDS